MKTKDKIIAKIKRLRLEIPDKWRWFKCYELSYFERPYIRKHWALVAGTENKGIVASIALISQDCYSERKDFFKDKAAQFVEEAPETISFLLQHIEELESELSRLKDEGEGYRVVQFELCEETWKKLTPIERMKFKGLLLEKIPAEQSDKSIISATNDNPFGAVKELAEQTKNDVEVDSDVKIYNERQDLQAQFRKPSEQSDKLTAEDLIKTIVLDKANLEYIAKTGVINGTLYIEIKRVIKEYASQFVGEKVTDEMIDKYYPTVETGAYNSMNFARQEGAKALRDGKIK